MINQSSPKCFGFNINQLFNIMLATLSATITAIGTFGIFYQVNGSREYNVKLYMKMLSCITFVSIGYLIIYTVISNAKNIRNLFDIAHESFLTSEHCRQLFYKMEIFGDNFTIFFVLYSLLFCMVTFSYIISPILWNNKEEVFEISQGNDSFLKINVLNFMYPITNDIYNKFYKIIYIMESFMCLYSFYLVFVFDVFLIVSLKIISTQYEIILSAYEMLKLENKKEKGKLMLFQVIYYVYCINFF